MAYQELEMYWRGMTKDERVERHDRPDIDFGWFGLLREDTEYGGPSAIQALVPEMFFGIEERSCRPISAAKLREHLPKALEFAKERGRMFDHAEYLDNHPVLLSIANFVRLAERQEQETGEPVWILALWNGCPFRLSEPNAEIRGFDEELAGELMATPA